MKLGEKQETFAVNFGLLLLFAFSKGYRTRIGEVKRTEQQALANARTGKGIADSVHLLKLAADIFVFAEIDGQKKWLKKVDDLKPLGDYWKGLHPMNRWGGDWKRPDVFHFSMRHGGRE